MHILVRNQNFEKQKKWNSKIPEPHLLFLESMKYLKKSGHGVEWDNEAAYKPFISHLRPSTGK
jgi:hypothetical protein